MKVKGKSRFFASLRMTPEFLMPGVFLPKGIPHFVRNDKQNKGFLSLFGMTNS